MNGVCGNLAARFHARRGRRHDAGRERCSTCCTDEAGSAQARSRPETASAAAAAMAGYQKISARTLRHVGSLLETIECIVRNGYRKRYELPANTFERRIVVKRLRTGVAHAWRREISVAHFDGLERGHDLRRQLAHAACAESHDHIAFPGAWRSRCRWPRRSRAHSVTCGALMLEASNSAVMPGMGFSLAA